MGKKTWNRMAMVIGKEQGDNCSPVDRFADNWSSFGALMLQVKYLLRLASIGGESELTRWTSPRQRVRLMTLGVSLPGNWFT